ncbi:hypothetical protein [Shewanella sp. SR44-3]|uniref:hypothetical protein n=1 Tax=Shewanella sp. SR44-3 TaxID=2760936 RepID=UPI0015FD164D|nr:hypothetical protein [Shewanella sp. SR44-3]MBB1271181.1 hypothetical protein [Shewanella sp. SR44-3]
MIEYLKLASIILTPLIPVVIISAIFYRNRHSDNEHWSFSKYCFSFDPHHGLTSQPIFWMTIIYPIALFFSTGIWIWHEYSLDISAAGYSKFIDISKLPIGLLGLSIPLSILTSRLHGTKQTALQIDKAETQIRETQQKNKTDLYLAHYKHFCDHISTLEDPHLSFNKKLLYKQLYPLSSISYGVGVVSFELFERISYRIQELYHLLGDDTVSDSNQAKEIFSKLSVFIELTLNEMHINSIDTLLKERFNSDTIGQIAFYICNDNELIYFVDFLANSIEYIYDFNEELDMYMSHDLRMNLVPGEIPKNVEGNLKKWIDLTSLRFGNRIHNPSR